MGKNQYKTVPGDPTVMGVTECRKGIQFTVSVPQGKAELYLFHEKEAEPFRIIPLEEAERTGTVSSILLDLPENETYTYLYRIDGRFHIDPYARAVCPVSGGKDIQWRGMIRPGSLSETAPANVAFQDMFLYKLHVRGFTMQKKGGIKHPGTFAGTAEMIPYLQKLGVNAVLLMPVYEFSLTDRTQKNYWGYTGGLYFAPRYAYSASGDPCGEFAGLVDSLHKAGMCCFLEFSFSYDEDPRLVTDVLRYWRLQYHVDGFRLAGNGPWLSSVNQDPLLMDTALFLPEAVEDRITENRLLQKRKAVYHPEYRDRIRRFLKGDQDISPEDTAWMLRRNGASFTYVQYLADQDGFTLADMVAYEERHNEQNGEENRDGNPYNYTWNCGEEGPSRRAAVCRLRERQLRNAVLLLMTSQSVPMLYAGDEMLNSQGGNNNAWCQDNSTGWTDWKRTKKADEMMRFVEEAAAFRRAHPVLRQAEPLRQVDFKACGLPDISYHSHAAWMHEETRLKAALGVLYSGAYAKRPDGSPDDTMYILYNMYWKTQTFALPEPPAGKQWVLKADTSAESVFYPDGEEPAAVDNKAKEIPVSPRSIRILLAR